MCSYARGVNPPADVFAMRLAQDKGAQAVINAVVYVPNNPLNSRHTLGILSTNRKPKPTHPSSLFRSAI